MCYLNNKVMLSYVATLILAASIAPLPAPANQTQPKELNIQPLSLMNSTSWRIRMSFASYKCCTLWTLRYMNTTWWHTISSLFNLTWKLTRKVVLHRLAHIITCTNSLRKQQPFCDAITGFLHEMMSEEMVQKFHASDATIPKCGQCFWLNEANFQPISTIQIWV